ncbi:hypothetical protein [Xenorhabdus anantnagensis]|uniref:Uncharacterized protein n=1 Tax=Xenorhabdus anantnagensis TaxID=3025875 RepID=A0ABT5LUP9_9GAMM|nr:hypothetical protein [Xenorhabdus anantnagensis]MDC9598152.1 hypothetical protein [Xenorhabdus anantnagensis]
MRTPKKIHYFWTGNNVSESFIENIIIMKAENPGFEINLWVSNKVLIIKTFRAMTKNCGEIFGCDFDKIRRKKSTENEENMGELKNQISSHYAQNPIHPTKQIKLINLANPLEPVNQTSRNNSNNQIGWQDNRYKKYPDGIKDTWVASRVIPEIRFDMAYQNTGPGMYEKYLKDIDKDRLPNDARPSAAFRVEKGKEHLFEKVDASGKWRNVSKIHDIHHDDTEFPSSSNLSLMHHNKIMKFIKK